MRTAAAALMLAGLALATAAGAAVSSVFVEVERDRLETLRANLELPAADAPHRDVSLSTWAGAAADYFARRKLDPRLRPTPLALNPALRDRANAALEDRFYLQDVVARQPRTTDGGLDWHAQGPRDDREWAWMLNRHLFLRDLLLLYQETGDIRYRAQLNALVRDWVTANPYPDRLTFSAPWRALEVARRVLEVWLEVFFANGDVLDDEVRLLMLASLRDHADALDEHASFWGGNHLITEKLALLKLALAFPEFRDAGEWRNRAVATVERQLFAQTYPDGAYKELANHYQRIVLEAYTRFAEALALVPGHEARERVEARVYQLWHYYLGVARPSGYGPINNDSDWEDNFAFARRIGLPVARPDWRYQLSNGAEGTRPAGIASRLYPWAGHAVLRDHWGHDSWWLFFDAGPHGTAHQHHDTLHLSFSAYGSDVLIDTGRYIYQPGPLRTYFAGPAGHNVVLLNGKGARRPPKAVRVPREVPHLLAEDFAWVGGEALFAPPATGQGAVPWRRQIFWHPPLGVVVVDELAGFGTAEITALWHFAPEQEITLAPASTVVRSRRETFPTANLQAATPNVAWELTTARGQLEPEVAGWFAPDYNVRVATTRVTFRTVTSLPKRFVWLLTFGETPGGDRVDAARYIEGPLPMNAADPRVGELRRETREALEALTQAP